MNCCYLCGKKASTIDHVPPQGFFVDTPHNIIRNPACERCNQTASRDEEYMRITLAAMGYDRSAIARQVWEGAVRQSFRRRPKGLKSRLARDLAIVEVVSSKGNVAVQLPGLKVDGERAARVLRKIVRGLHYHDRGARLTSDDELLLFRDADILAKGLNFAISSSAWPEIDMGEAFRYRSLHSEDGSAYWFEFYRAHWWLALIGEAARTYPR